MLKRLGIRKLTISIMSIVLIGLIYLFPTKDIKVNKTVTLYEESDLSVVYLLNKDNYLSEVNVLLDSEEPSERIKEKINMLIKENDLPKHFKSVLPNNAKVLSVNIKEDICTIDFSKELLSIEAYNEEKLIEEIVYTITSEEDINKVVIKVEGKVLERLPHSNKLLPKELDRTYGINKNYDISDINNLTKTTIYFISKENDQVYYTPVTYINNENEEKIKVIVNELKSSPLFQSNLNSYLNNKAVLKKYEIEETAVNLTFNDKIFDSIYNQNILEEVVYTLGKSIKENYNVKEVNFYVEDKEIISF